MKIKFEVTINPFAWVIARNENGTALLEKDVSGFDLKNREDIIVNKYGVVCCYDSNIMKLVINSSIYKDCEIV